MIQSMKPETGRMAVVLPHGVLFRMGQEGKIRRKILEMNYLDAVIGRATTCSTAPAWLPVSSFSAGRTGTTAGC